MAQSYEDRLIRVVTYIHDHLDGDLSLDALADVAALSRFHFHRVWTGMTGETLAQTTRRIRLYRAAVALVQEPGDLSSIAAQCGYRDQSAFTRAFRETFGVTPGVYRARARAVPPLRAKTGKSDKMYDVDIRMSDPKRIAGIMHKGDYMTISQAFETASATMAARDGFAQTRGMVGLYWDDARSKPKDELRSCAGFIVSDEFTISPPFEQVELPGGRVAVLIFRGAYTGLQGAYDFLFGDWLQSSGAVPRDVPCVELYVNSPAEVAPEDLVTEIHLALE